MVRLVRVAGEPVRRFQLLWNLVGCGIASVFMIIGSGFAVGGERATSSSAFALVQNLERPVGGLHAHGFIMMGLALFLAYGMGDYRKLTRRALQLVTFYSLCVAFMVFGSWTIYSVSFGAPWWYLFTAFLSIVLLVIAPPLNPHGRLHQTGGGGRA